MKKREIEAVSPEQLPSYQRWQETDRRQRQTICSSGALVATLSNSVLTDSKGRIGGIVANHQFQFDGPPSQAGTIYNSGWSVCSNGSLALGPSAIFYQCLSGTFYNLYNTPAGASCEAVIITVIPCSGSATGGASQASDGQPTVASAVTQATEGQIQASSAAPKVTQITDGQVQASSAVLPVSQYTDGQIQVTAPPVSEATEGQPRVTTTATSAAAPVSEATEGQPRVTTTATSAAAPVSEASEGQPRVTTTATSAAAPVSEATEGQPRVTTTATSAAAPVSEATEGQPQVTANATKPSTTPTPTTSPIVATGLAPAMTAGAQVVLAIAGFVAIAML